VFWYTVCHVCGSLLPREVAPGITNGRLDIWLELDCRYADQSEPDDAIDQAERQGRNVTRHIPGHGHPFTGSPKVQLLLSLLRHYHTLDGSAT
jgi:hypothetical protein